MMIFALFMDTSLKCPLVASSVHFVSHINFNPLKSKMNLIYI